MKTTPNIGLRKPDQEDFYNVDDFNYNADVIDQEIVKRIINSGGVPSIQAGLDASKPAPGTVGQLYVATDTQIIYRDTGSAWQKVGAVKWGDIEGKPASFTPTPHKSTHATGGSDPLTPADIGAIPTSAIGAANGVAELDGSSQIPLVRIPGTLTGKSADTVDGHHASDFPLLGIGNQDVNMFLALNQRIDTRSLTMSYDGSGNLTQIAEQDGATTVKTTTFTYSGGNLTQVQEVVGGKTITTTFSYDGANNLTGTSRTVS